MTTNSTEDMSPDERREFWNNVLAGMNHQHHLRPTTAADEQALSRLWPKGEAGFPGRASLFAIRHGWRGGTPAQACTYIEQNRLVDALAGFHAGTGVSIDLSKLPRDENGDIIATEL